MRAWLISFFDNGPITMKTELLLNMSGYEIQHNFFVSYLMKKIKTCLLLRHSCSDYVLFKKERERNSRTSNIQIKYFKPFSRSGRDIAKWYVTKYFIRQGKSCGVIFSILCFRFYPCHTTAAFSCG